VELFGELHHRCGLIQLVDELAVALAEHRDEVLQAVTAFFHFSPALEDDGCALVPVLVLRGAEIVSLALAGRLNRSGILAVSSNSLPISLFLRGDEEACSHLLVGFIEEILELSSECSVMPFNQYLANGHQKV